MKKKLLAVVAAMTMILSTGMTAFAAGSPAVEDNYFATAATTMINGVTVNLDFDYYLYDESLTEKEKAELDKYFTAETEEAGDAYIKALFESVTGYTASTEAGKTPVLIDFFGLELPEGIDMPAGGIDVTINATYVEATDTNWFMFHLKDDGTWEWIKTTPGNGTLTGRFTSLSPVYIISAPDAKAPVASNTPAPADNKTKAPKTGEFGGVYVAGILALISAAGIVVYTRKQKVVR